MMRVFSFDLVSKLMLGTLGLLLIRWMPEQEYARYTIALAAATFATQTLSSTFNRVYILGYERLGLHAAPAAFLGFQLLVLGVAAVGSFPLRGFAAGLYPLVVALAIATCLSEFAKTRFQQEQRFNRFTQVELARSALSLAAVLALAWWARGDVRAAPVLLVQAAALVLVFAAAAPARGEWRHALHPGHAGRIMLRVLNGGYTYVFAYFVLLGLLTQMDIFVLSERSSQLQLASFGAAFRYYSLLSLALAAVHTVLLPLMQQVRTPAEEDRIMARQWRLLALFAPVIAVGAWASGWIIPWIDGGRYPDAVPAFRLLAVSAVLSFAFSPHANVVLRFEDFRYLFTVMIIAVVGQFVLLTAMVPARGAVGAATATLITFALANGATFLRARVLRRRWAASFAALPPAAMAHP
jgi:O-antigen/teichoic acid export membrane protein